MSIVAAFDRARNYDQYAHLQAKVANSLAEIIVAQRLKHEPRVLEIGCGTGFLGAALIDRLGDAQWLMTDVAPAMVARTRNRFAGDPRVKVALMDGENPHGETGYDLICSSLAMQWFRDFPSAVNKLRRRLAADGLLAFTTLIDGSFTEWRAAHSGETAGTPDYPSPAALKALGLSVAITNHTVHYGDARTFLSALKKIGAGTPRSGHRPLTPPALKRVMARFQAMGSVATYAVATCMIRAD
jgi:malonyl-CoA O-methyltransferase